MRRLSPVADLLRNSRLFALPTPLPPPAKPSTSIAITGQGVAAEFDSDTATIPHPTHAAIETTERSLARGDWGLKRSLPLRSTMRTSNPTIKIDNVDSIDYITDFSSAADHVRTLEKWQEIDMPMSVMLRERRASAYQPAPKSVFEPEIDNTAVTPKSGQERWKFKGPWLAGKSKGEFNAYLEQKVKKRKADFREFLRQRLMRSHAAVRRQEMQENSPETDTMEVAEEEVDVFVKRLRKDPDTMYRLIEEFLDLPREQSDKRQSTYHNEGPPITHPSAGLSYLRTASHTLNHPINGPQEDKSPILARILKPQSPSGRAKTKAMLGVAGVVAEDARQPFTTSDEQPGIVRMNPDTIGGGKIWVQPKRADIDTMGRIKLGLKRAEKNAVDVRKADLGVPKEDELPAAAVETATNRNVPDLAPSRQGAARGSQSYGLEDIARSERAKPFEGESDLSALLGKALQGRRTS